MRILLFINFECAVDFHFDIAIITLTTAIFLVITLTISVAIDIVCIEDIINNFLEFLSKFGKILMMSEPQSGGTDEDQPLPL